MSKGLPERASRIVRGELSDVVLLKVFATRVVLNIAPVARHKKDGRRNETKKESGHHGRDQSTCRPPKHEPEARLVRSMFGARAIGHPRRRRRADRCQHEHDLHPD
ncbi:MAG TPA: hypothetical protein VIG25_24195 [Pyrinomonadaceae bacterium]